MLRRIYRALPLPYELRRRIATLRWRWAQRRAARRAGGNVDVPVHGAPPIGVPMRAAKRGEDVRFPAPRPGTRDYLFFGVIDWHFRHQRPQQIAQALARQGRRVFYFSVNFVDAAGAGVSIEPLDPALPLYQVFLHVRGPLSVYAMQASGAQAAQLRQGLRELWVRAGIQSAVSVIQHPFWHAVGGRFPAARTVYDCMDHHAGFSNTADGHTRDEHALMAQADLVVVTSDDLERRARPLARRVALVRNAGDFDHFHRAAVPREAASPSRRPVIGYYGAIAEWFDTELVERLARRFDDCDFVLIGEDSAGVGRALRGLPNVRMTGEKPYAELPRWLAGFDACLIPFRINELTLATNPVKVYEYLAAGRPVVGTDLPELAQFGDLVYRAADADAFEAAVRAALAEPRTPACAELPARRIAFAREQTWAHRAARFVEAAEDADGEPSVSVVVVAYNQWALTRRCLESLEAARDGVPTQVIVVDNASADGTGEHLRAWAAQAPERRIAVINAENRGFGGGVNSGMAHASGDYFVVLNNDTIVGPGWARGLRRHFERDPGLGIVCPVTNNIGNEAQVALPGSTPDEVFASARRYTLDRTGQAIELTVAAFFCVMLPRAVWERTGPMDERFFPGFFEDDDYCLRLRAQGLRVGCAEDVFVFHELSATFNAESQARRQAIFERNRALFEEKWGPWKPHAYRPESLPESSTR